MNLPVTCVILSLAFAGCAPIPIKLAASALPAGQLDAERISIVDLTKPSYDAPSGLGLRFHRISDKVFERLPGETLKTDLERSLIASGAGKPLDVWLVDAGFYWEKTGADFIPVLNLFSSQRSGRFKCDATVSVRVGVESMKATIEHYVSSVDTEGLQTGEMLWKNAARECYPQLLSKIVSFIRQNK
jgi:hypothetical protein